MSKKNVKRINVNHYSPYGERKDPRERRNTDIVNQFIEGVKDGEVHITGIGRFQVNDIAAHNGYNPVTGERQKVKASKRISFRPSSGIKRVLDEME